TLAQRQGSTPTPYPTATTTAWFGSFGAGNHVLAGHLGELAFYPASVDPASVAAHASITDAAAYRAAVEATGPASYWRFDRHASAAVPLAAGSSGSFPLTTTCRVRTLSPFANAWFGLVGMSHAFTAPNDVATGPFTAEFWMRPTAYGGAPLSFGTGAAGSTPALLLDANGFGFTSGSGDVWGAPAPALNTWTHVAARFPNGDRSGARLFLNGVEQTLTQRVGATPATLPTAATAARFGALGASANVFAGTLAELAVYPAAVDPAVVAAHAAATVP
ncbi:MAG: LamG domain-containing protein, partial [Acidimicrobiales bacterium]|nr:LamG domain-containing protein [Acidimicrobiales bacterium]